MNGGLNLRIRFSFHIYSAMAVACSLIIKENMKSLNIIEEVRKTKVESERITNISELEKIIQSARVDVVWLKTAIEDGNVDTMAHLVGQIDLKLHQMEAFNFNMERRTITVKD